jgi:hypothetical protein
MTGASSPDEDETAFSNVQAARRQSMTNRIICPEHRVVSRAWQPRNPGATCATAFALDK